MRSPGWQDTGQHRSPCHGSAGGCGQGPPGPGTGVKAGACGAAGRLPAAAKAAVGPVVGPTEEVRMGTGRGCLAGLGAGGRAPRTRHFPRLRTAKAIPAVYLQTLRRLLPLRARCQSGSALAGPTAGLFSNALLCFIIQERGYKDCLFSYQKGTDKSL